MKIKMTNPSTLFAAALVFAALPLSSTKATAAPAAPLMLSWQGDKGKAADASDKKAPPKDDPKIAEMIKAFKKVVRGKSTKDTEGARILDDYTDRYSKLNKKQQKAVAKSAGSAFRARRKPDEVVLYLSAGEALSRFKENGAAELAKVAKDRRFRKKEWSTMRSQMIRLLGRPADKRYIGLLLDIALKDNDPEARGKAGEALGYYSGYPQATRKNVVKELVKTLEEVYAQSRANIDPNDVTRATWVERYAAIQDPWMKTLGRMTGQSIKDVQGWTKWWNKNKRSNWDKKGFKGAAPKG